MINYNATNVGRRDGSHRPGIPKEGLSRNHFAVVHVPLGWKILEPPAGGTEKLIGSYDQ
jgi:hypothetical protein